jgi:hypothetical protein
VARPKASAETPAIAAARSERLIYVPFLFR